MTPNPPTGDPSADARHFSPGQVIDDATRVAYAAAYDPHWLLTALNQRGLTIGEGGVLVRRAGEARMFRTGWGGII